jgi:aspartate-semialdehyde dehydrogenase
MNKNVAVIGASGAIGNAFVEHYSNDQSVNTVYAFSRKNKVMKIKKFKVMN